MAGVVTLWGMTTGLQQVQHSQLAQQNKVDLTLVQAALKNSRLSWTQQSWCYKTEWDLISLWQRKGKSVLC